MDACIPIGETDAEKIGPISESKVENVPGFFEVMEKLSDLPASELASSDPAFLSTVISPESLSALYIETGEAWNETFLYEVMSGNMRYREYFKSDGFRNLIDRLRGVTVLDSREEECQAVVAELHCPKINNCKAYYTHKTVSSVDHFIKITIFGYGGGSGISFKTGIGHRIPAKMECIQILKPIKIRIEECTGPNRTFYRVHVLDVKKMELNVNPMSSSTSVDLCQMFGPTKNQSWNITKFNSRYADTPTKAWYEVEQGKVSSFQAPVNIGPVSIELKVSTQALKFNQYEYELYGPQEYYAYIFPEKLGFYWTW